MRDKSDGLTFRDMLFIWFIVAIMSWGIVASIEDAVTEAQDAVITMCIMPEATDAE